MIPFCLKTRAISLPMSASRVGSSESNSSTTVTARPNSANMVANSQPAIPPPTISIDSGREVMASTSVVFMTFSPSKGKAGSLAGSVPVAIIMLVAWIWLVLLALSVTSRILGPVSLAVAEKTCTLRFFSSPATPWRSSLTTRSLKEQALA